MYLQPVECYTIFQLETKQKLLDPAPAAPNQNIDF